MHSVLDINTITNPGEKEKLFEQYRIIYESINQLNMMRETSNPFWLTANGLTISSVSYLNTLG
ncbi:MAG: hypothetical protein K0M45_01470 [Candidatus Paracaedibacteraceae bacterium]|nr:hypothetical protein [Candidatus Paracaedibacteraceae bacterium]